METKKPRGYGAIIAALCVILLITIICSITLGRFPISIKELLHRFFGVEFEGVSFTSTMEAILFNVRLPRIFLACLIGCCLSAAGASYQGVFQNPMAAPDILGASSGAATGAAIAIILQLPSHMIMLLAFAGSLATIAAVMVISRFAQGNKLLGIILAGVMVSSLCNAATSYIKLVADPNNILPQITYWLMGSLSKTKPSVCRRR